MLPVLLLLFIVVPIAELAVIIAVGREIGLPATVLVLLADAVLAQRLRAEGRKLRLRGPQPHIQKLIELMGLHRMPAVALDIG